jgi:hypothetical protein
MNIHKELNDLVNSILRDCVEIEITIKKFRLEINIDSTNSICICPKSGNIILSGRFYLDKYNLFEFDKLLDFVKQITTDSEGDENE